MTRAQISQTVRGYRRPRVADSLALAFVFLLYGLILAKGMGWL